MEELLELTNFSALADRGCDELSHGEKRGVEIALAIEPTVFLLDEPTEGLAPVIVDDLREMLHEVVSQDVTVLLSEQNVNFAFDLATRCYVIDTGSIVFEGSIEALRDREDLLEQYLAVSSEDVA